MKRMVPAMAIVCAVALGAAGAAAAEIPWTERPDVALTFGFLTYTEGGSRESGPIVGIEGRMPLAHRWSIGAAVAGGSDFVLYGDDLTITSLEANVARIVPASTRVAFSLGGGLAAVHGTFSEEHWLSEDVETTGWMLGGQVGGGVDWIPGRLVLGLRATYQFTQDFEDFGWGLDNWRATMRAGVAF